MLCMVGGALGVLLGFGAAIVLARVMQWNTLISPAAVAVAFGFSARWASSSACGRRAAPRGSIPSTAAVRVALLPPPHYGAPPALAVMM